MTAHAATAEVLRFNEGGPNRGTRAAALEFFSDRVGELSGGDVTVDVTWGGALLKLRDTAEGVSDGVADMGSIIANYTPNQTKALTIGDLPVGQSSDAWVGMRAMYELMTTNPDVQAQLAEENLVYISNYHSTSIQIECRDGSEVTTPEDLEGLRIRASGVYGKIFDDMGATLVNMPYNEVYQAYGSGLIDCDAGYFYTNRAYKLYEVIGDVLKTDFGQVAGFAIVMNKDRWDALDDGQQALLRQAGSDMVDHFAQLQIDGVDTMVAELSGGDFGEAIEVREAPAEIKDALFAAAEPYAESWRTEFSDAGFDGDAVWADYVAMIDKYTKIRDTEGYPWQR